MNKRKKLAKYLEKRLMEEGVYIEETIYMILVEFEKLQQSHEGGK